MTRSYRDEAIVLHTHKLGEADRIITLLTREHGQVRAVAKGVRKTNSRFGAHLEPFSVVDIQLHNGKTFDIVTQVMTITSHGAALAADYDLYTRGSVMLETAQRLTSDSADGAHAQYLLLVGGLHALAHRRYEPTLILNSYLLRSFAIAGWAPSFYDCASCGSEGPHSAFSVPDGGAVCDLCRPPGAGAPSPDALALMADLLSGDWGNAQAREGYARGEVSDLVASYAQWHLERRLKSLQFTDRNRIR